GISEEMGDVGLAIQRAEDKTASMQARAGAIDELLASGALDDFSGQRGDDIQAELDRMGGGRDVELELARMKAELGQGPAPQGAIESGPAQQGHAPSYQQAPQQYQQAPQQPQPHAQPTQEYGQPGEGR
ncbi:PspA/IM30 family protein, partial [Streptosporangium sandarakinum]